MNVEFKKPLLIALFHRNIIKLPGCSLAANAAAINTVFKQKKISVFYPFVFSSDAVQQLVMFFVFCSCALHIDKSNSELSESIYEVYILKWCERSKKIDDGGKKNIGD